MRGIATGANQFFTLTESERRTHRISRRDVVPCITKAANLDHEQFERTQLRRLIASNRKVWLLRPRTPLDDAVRDYLKVGVTLGIPERYLPAHRPEWYRPEQRSPAPIWVPVFARDQFRFVQNETDALHLTTFHGLYPNEPAGHDAIGTIVQFLRSAEGQRNVIAHTRIYGGGLRKLEPRDVLAIEIPTSIACAIRNSSDQKIEQSGNESLQ
jgi:adenine-specific DNA-methyltransferase